MNRAGLLRELTRHLDRQITRARRARLNLSVLTLVNDVPGHPPGPRARGFCRVQRHRYRLPPGDDPGVRPRLGVVLDKRKPTAQLDGGGELAAPLKCGADRRGILIVDGKHRQSMQACATADKLVIVLPRASGVASGWSVLRESVNLAMDGCRSKLPAMTCSPFSAPSSKSPSQDRRTFGSTTGKVKPSVPQRRSKTAITQWS